MAQVTILGARSFVAPPLIAELSQAGYEVSVVSRQPQTLAQTLNAQQFLSLDALISKKHNTDYVISLMPIWISAQVIPKLELSNTKVIALSSSSVTTKQNASNQADRDLVSRLFKAEQSLKDDLKSQAVQLCILRPTMVFGYGQDHNVSFILRQLQKTHLMPFIGKATGLRQPLYANDLARAIVLALRLNQDTTLALGGASKLAYKDMVHEIARVARVAYLPLQVPQVALEILLPILRLSNRYKFLEIGMFERMNQDLDIDLTPAQKLIGFSPLGFTEALEQDLLEHRSS